MSLELEKNDEYRKRLDAAIDAREDGDAEDSVSMLETLLADFPNDPDATIEYVNALKILGKLKDADLVLARSIQENPDHFRLRKCWAELPSLTVDHEESQKRGPVLRRLFPPATHPGSWPSLSIELDGLYEMGKWNELADRIDQHWNDFTAFPNILPAGIAALNKLFLTDRLQALLDAALPPAWKSLPPEAASNLRLRCELARSNHRLLAETGIKVISIGQNCLPYLLGGRWGLIAQRADTTALTPFDLGGFRNDSVADAIDTRFEAYLDREQYVVARAWGGGEAMRHRTTGIDFFHERGPYWVTPDRARFFARIEQMIARWNQVKDAGKRLFVFCYCGAGSLDRLVEVADKYLLGPDSHLLILDVLKQPHDCPRRARVTYRHTPYPDDFEWTSIAHQNSVRGMKFELSVVTPIIDLVARFGSDVYMAQAAAEHRSTLRAAANQARASGHTENSIALFGSLVSGFPGDSYAAMEYAEALRRLNKVDEADAVLTSAIEYCENDIALRKSWMELPAHSADWDECIRRANVLRTQISSEAQQIRSASLTMELTALYDSGRWSEINDFIQRNWADFTGRPELVVPGIDVLSRQFRHAKVLELLDAATPAARQGLSDELAGNLRNQLSMAQDNLNRYRDSGVSVLSLGRNAMPYTIAGRWGLMGEPARFENLTPFDICEFPPFAAANAVATDFAAYEDQDQFVAGPTWFGGSMLVHRPSGANFFSHRRAQWLEEDRRHFFAHWQIMLTNWRRRYREGRRVFVLFVSDQIDLDALVNEFAGRLLDEQAFMVIVDTRAKGGAPPTHHSASYLHAPLPAGYAWTRSTACATSAIMAYERRIISAITAHMV